MQPVSFKGFIQARTIQAYDKKLKNIISYNELGRKVNNVLEESGAEVILSAHVPFNYKIGDKVNWNEGYDKLSPPTHFRVYIPSDKGKDIEALARIKELGASVVYSNNYDHFIESTTFPEGQKIAIKDYLKRWEVLNG